MLKMAYKTEWENINDMIEERKIEGEVVICLSREEFDEYIYQEGGLYYMIDIMFEDGSTYTFYDEIADDTEHKMKHVREFYPDGRVYLNLIPYPVDDDREVCCTFWFECFA